jgi:thiol-disulfide isomerase/thioredoxin
VSSINLSNYKFENIKNKITSIELEKSKTYLLDFWFINCPPCVRDHKLIVKKLDFLKEKNIELIGISTDRNYSDWKNYLTKHDYNWKNFREIDTLKRVTKEMVIWSFPTYLLLDNNGNIKARFNSFEDFENYVNK